MTSLNLLLLEDHAPTAQMMKERLESPSVTVHVVALAGEWKSTLSAGDWDLVVTDMKNDANEELAGDLVVDDIFDRRFVPLVVHSGLAGLKDHFSEERIKHPFLRVVFKNDDGALDEVEKHIGVFKSVALELRRVREEMNKAVQATLTETVSSFGMTLEEWTPVLSRVARRRVAGSFDEPTPPDRGIHAVERYLIPAISPHLLTGDILRATAGDETRLVLTQSCDLAWWQAEAGRKARTPNVAAVLAACPVTAAQVVDGESEFLGKTDKFKRAVEEAVSGQLLPWLVVLPAVPGSSKAPLLFDLRHLELIPIENIKQGCATVSAQPAWKRIASQDSPFREQMMWSFLNVQGRPALPEVDRGSVIEACTPIFQKAVEAEKKKKEEAEKSKKEEAERKKNEEAERVAGTPAAKEGNPRAQGGAASSGKPSSPAKTPVAPTGPARANPPSPSSRAGMKPEQARAGDEGASPPPPPPPPTTPTAS